MFGKLASRKKGESGIEGRTRAREFRLCEECYHANMVPIFVEKIPRPVKPKLDARPSEDDM